MCSHFQFVLLTASFLCCSFLWALFSHCLITRAAQQVNKSSSPLSCVDSFGEADVLPGSRITGKEVSPVPVMFFLPLYVGAHDET